MIVLLPLGGSSMINGNRGAELEELKRISSNIFALIDSERSVPGAPLQTSRQAFAESCKSARVTCHVLARRATENYFSDRAVKVVKGSKYAALSEFGALSGVAPAWAKKENWRIAREMTLDELKGTDLLEFLESL